MKIWLLIQLFLLFSQEKLAWSLAGMTVSDERKESVDFTDSYATGVQAIIVKEGSKIKTNKDLLKRVPMLRLVFSLVQQVISIVQMI